MKFLVNNLIDSPLPEISPSIRYCEVEAFACVTENAFSYFRDFFFFFFFFSRSTMSDYIARKLLVQLFSFQLKKEVLLQKLHLKDLMEKISNALRMQRFMLKRRQ